MAKQKLVVAIINPDDEDTLVAVLNENKLGSTKIPGRGGFLNKNSAVLLIGVAHDQLDSVLAIIKKACKSRTEYISSAPPLADPGEFVIARPVEIKVGGAVVFVVDADLIKF